MLPVVTRLLRQTNSHNGNSSANSITDDDNDDDGDGANNNNDAADDDADAAAAHELQPQEQPITRISVALECEHSTQQDELREQTQCIG